MSEPKYYYPTIEEFHVGFECEVYHPHSLETKDGFEPETYGVLTEVWWNRSMENLIQNKEVRVKYLDREDIESLGWKDVGQDEYQIDVKDSAFSWQLEKVHDDVLQSFWRLNTEDNSQIIWLQIRNKSELARVMKMVGITNN